MHYGINCVFGPKRWNRKIWNLHFETFSFYKYAKFCSNVLKLVQFHHYLHMFFILMPYLMVLATFYYFQLFSFKYIADARKFHNSHISMINLHLFAFRWSQTRILRPKNATETFFSISIMWNHCILYDVLNRLSEYLRFWYQKVIYCILSMYKSVKKCLKMLYS